jgi:A1 cistron-splicing factor AAR2
MEASTTQGATVLLLNLPPSALGGINLLSFTTTGRFKGIKLLPPGVHFVFTGTDSSLSIRHGAWFRVADKGPDSIQLFIKKWDTKGEELVEETDQAEILRWRANLGSIWREGLTPYRQSTGKEGQDQEDKDDWKFLTENISDHLLQRIAGNTPNHWGLTSASSATRDVEDIPGLPSNSSDREQDKILNFLPIELKRTWRPGATGRERTEAALDHTWALADLVEQHCGGDDTQILGEMQFCFLMVLTLNNYSCLEQWKRILTLLFTCHAAVEEKPEFFVKAIQVLKIQLQHCGDAEGGLFDLSDDGAGLLRNLLRKFKKDLKRIEGIGKSDVVDELEELEASVRRQYGWELDDNFVRRGMLTLEDGERVEVTMTGYDEEDESGEYAPTVVGLSSDEIRALGGPSDSSKSGGDESEDEQDLEGMDSRY